MSERRTRRKRKGNILVLSAILMIALMAGWVINNTRMRQDIGIQQDFSWAIWKHAVRYLAPAAILCMFVVNLLE